MLQRQTVGARRSWGTANPTGCEPAEFVVPHDLRLPARERGPSPSLPVDLMGLTYFKRFRMEIDLSGPAVVPPPAPPGYRLYSWDDSLLEAHAEAKYQSFRGEIDSNVFACLGDWVGCHRLMQEIRGKPGFLPGATWLAGHVSPNGDEEYCGTIQGIRDYSGMGAIQNLGVTPEHRDRRLGTCLLLRALEGFQRAGLSRAFLEVTAQNGGAIRLYEREGFVKARTVYKAVEVAYS